MGSVHSPWKLRALVMLRISFLILWANRGSLAPLIFGSLEMFGGRERKERLYNLIFGDPSSTLLDSKTRINSLHNMVTLAAHAHRSWTVGKFILEPLEEGFNTHELKARVLWMPKRSTGPGEIGIDTIPASLELTPIQPNGMFVALPTYKPIEDGHIVTFKTSDPEDLLLPDRDLLMLQVFLIPVLRMAGRAGEDMLETFDNDDEVSSIAASDSGQSEHHTVTTNQNPCHENHGPEKSSLPTTSSYLPELSADMNAFLDQHDISALKQPPENHSSTVNSPWLRMRKFSGPDFREWLEETNQLLVPGRRDRLR